MPERHAVATYEATDGQGGAVLHCPACGRTVLVDADGAVQTLVEGDPLADHKDYASGIVAQLGAMTGGD